MKTSIVVLAALFAAASARAELDKTKAAALESEFKVDDARVQSLRDRKLGYGEVGIVLGLAEKMPGGITDANVDAVLKLREGPPKMGWGKVAKELGFKLGPVMAKVHKVDKASKPERREKPAKPEKPQRPERPARPERPSHH